MIRAATVHARLHLSRSYARQAVQAKSASSWPFFPRSPPLLGRLRTFYQMDTRGQDESKMLTTRGCHSSPESQELAKKSCVPCNSKEIRPMSEDSAKKLLEQVHGWELTNRRWYSENTQNMEGHHPDLHLVGWNNVKIDVWTHSVSGLTENDFILAAKINNLDLQDLLSKKARVQ